MALSFRLFLELNPVMGYDVAAFKLGGLNKANAQCRVFWTQGTLMQVQTQTQAF